MLLSMSIVIALGRRLVSWSMIEAAEVDLTFEMLFGEIKVVNLTVFPCQRNKGEHNFFKLLLETVETHW